MPTPLTPKSDKPSIYPYSNIAQSTKDCAKKWKCLKSASEKGLDWSIHSHHYPRKHIKNSLENLHSDIKV